MAKLSAAERARLPDKAFAYVDSRGERRLPIHDESHVRNALARFDQVRYETEGAREKARERLLRAAKRYGIMPIGFIARQLRRGTAAAQPELPEGTVCLLFTDIEDSTGHLRELGEGYEGLLDQVRHVVRRCVLAADGLEVEVRADETFWVFSTATDAVEAAVGMQRDIGTASWPGGRAVRVRAGIHRGKVRLTSNGYIGLAVHKAARVCSAAHGGQIVTSSKPRPTQGTRVDVAFRNLGRHPLAGLDGTHLLYQVEADGLAADFPPLRTPR